MYVRTYACLSPVYDQEITQLYCIVGNFSLGFSFANGLIREDFTANRLGLNTFE